MGLTDHIKKHIALRKEQAPLRYGGYRQVYLDYRKPFVFERFYDGERVFIAVNIGESEERISLDGCGALSDLLTGELFEPFDIPLEPHCSRILMRALPASG